MTSSGVKESADRVAAAASEKLHDAGSKIRETAEATRLAASEAYRKASERAGIAAEKTSSGIESNPVAALVGGLAIGAVLGALLPRTDKEADLLGPLGTRANDSAKAAFAAARTAGQERLNELGVNSDTAREQFSKLFETVSDAARSAGTAAVGAAKEGRTA